MKFDFEKAKANVKKIVLPATVFLSGVGSLSAQDKINMDQKAGIDKTNESIEYLNKTAVDTSIKDAKDIKQKTVILFNKLKDAGVVVNMTEEEFDELPEDVMKDLIKHFMNKTGRISPEEFLALNKTGTVISRENHTIREKEELETEKNKSLETEYTFNDFWSDQMEAIKQGKANWGDKVYWEKTNKWYVLENSKDKKNEVVKSTPKTESFDEDIKDIDDDVYASTENVREKYVPVVDHFENRNN